MKRTAILYIQDILLSIEKIREYTKGMTKETFMNTPLVFDAVVRNLEIIGEASRYLAEFSLATEITGVPWHELRGMRNILIHEYFGVDGEIIWAVITQDLEGVYDVLSSYR